MPISTSLRAVIPEQLKQRLRPIRNRIMPKYSTQLSFWKSRLVIDNGRFFNAHYERIMLAMAEQSTDNFLQGKIVADFGCGPRGSLVWARSAHLRIGIDVLADRYADEFPDNILSHEMIYLKSTEYIIPLPSGFVDILFTINALDNVDHFQLMCNEMLRILKPSGEFIGSFTLEKPRERQKLNEAIIKQGLLRNLEVQSYRVTARGPSDDDYAPFFTGSLSYQDGQEGFLWVRAKKPKEIFTSSRNAG